MAITGDDVSLDQIVPVSRDFTLEEGATGLGGMSPSPLGPQGMLPLQGLGCSMANGLFISLPTVSPDGELYILGEWSFQRQSQLGQGVRDPQTEEWCEVGALSYFTPFGVAGTMILRDQARQPLWPRFHHSPCCA